MAEEMTNQSVSETSTNDDDFLVDELGSEEKNESSESSKNSTPESFMKIRYNGADKELSQEEAITLAQKGMNYDKVYGKYQELQNSPILKTVTALADRAGMSVNEYATKLQQFNEQASINELASDFMAQNPDATDEMAEQYAKVAYQNQILQAQQKEAQQTQAQQTAEQNRYIQEVKQFNSRYPDVDINNLPKDVIQDINDGTPLETAYLRHLNMELKNRVSNNETNAKNKDNATGNLSSQHTNDYDDAFISGLLG